MSQSSAFLRKSLVAAISAGTLMASYVQAGPASFQDARSFAMGGTGVASARSVGAPLKNPALLSIRHGEHQDAFGMLLPSLNARLAEDDLLDKADDAQDLWEELDDAVNNFNAVLNSGDTNAIRSAAGDVANRAEALNRKLTELDKSSVRGDLGLGTLIAVPGETLGFGLFADATARVAGIANYRDAQTIQDEFITPARAIADGTAPAALPDVDATLNSDAEAVAVAIGEVGVSLSHLFEVQGRSVAVGISPKVMRVDTYHYGEKIGDFDDSDFDAEEYKKSKTAFNFDLGVASEFGTENQWTAGFVIKNLIPQDFETKAPTGFDMYKVEVKPKATVGLAHQGDWHVLALDLDLTKTPRAGLDGDTQFIALGGELDLLRWAQLRVGIRHNLASNNSASKDTEESTQFTAGFGLTPFGMLLDVSAMVSDNDYGGALQFGAMF